jgi:amino acid adenylation domain-containing protein
MVTDKARLAIPDANGEHTVVAEAERFHTPMITEAERHQLAAWNFTYQDYPREVLVPQLVANQAAAMSQATALVVEGHATTYHDLNRQANRLANYLRSVGVGPNTLVCVCLERSLEMVVAFLGVLKAGGAYVPMDPTYPPLRLSFMMQDTQAPVLITCQSLAERLPAQDARVVSLDSDAAMIASASAADPTPTATPNSLAYVIYTSGSTGQPKGVQITHDALLNLVFWHQRAFSTSASDRATQLAGPAFDATVWELWPHLTIGASVYLPDEETRVTPARLRDWLIQQRITITFLPTTLAEAVITLEWPRQTALRFLLTGADTLHRYPAPNLPFTFVNNYGPTENTVVTTSGSISPAMPSQGLPSIGRPIANTQVYVLDQQLRQVPIGETGELYIGGASLSSGYLHRPDLTAQRFIPNLFSDEPGARLYRTGDLARFLPDGQIAFLGRNDTQIKIRGYRIEPDEIVSALNSHPAIETSVVVARARDNDAGDKSLVAYVVPAPGVQASVAALQEHLRPRLPDYMIPATFVLLEALPLTPNGKVDRAALPEPSAENSLRDDMGDETESYTVVEERVETIVASLLHLDRVGLDDNFFMLGGHSMLGTQVIAQMAETFGVDIPLRVLFEGPTVRELSAEVARLIVAQFETMSDEEVQRLVQ